NRRAGNERRPFSVTRQQVDYYRQSREVNLQAIAESGEREALREGLALKEERVRKLKLLAELIEEDLFGGFLWLDQVRGVGTGPIGEFVEYQEFGRAEIEAYRGLLDDLAKGVGGRIQKPDITSDGEALKI